MARRSKRPELTVRASFEAARIAPQCLAEAYERLVPVPRRLMRGSTLTGTPLGAPAVDLADRRRAEGG